MNWEDERYVRLFTRNTPTWLALGWEGRFVLMSLLRQVDRSGVLDVLAGEEVQAVASLIMAPPEIVEVGLGRLLERKVLTIGGDQLLWPKFLEAQESRASDRERQRKSRELRSLGSQNVTNGHNVTRPVTPSHDLSRLSPLAVPSHAEPCLDKVPRETAARPTLRARKPKSEKTADPRHAPLVQALVDACPGYAFVEGRDAAAVTKLLAKGEPIEVLVRWRRALARAGFPLVRQIYELATHWNHFATDQPTGKKPSAFAAADRDVEHVVGEIKL